MAIELNGQREIAFLDRYAQKDENGDNKEKSVEELWERVARAISDTESEEMSFFEILKDFRFVPGGRILAGAGAGTEQTFYNCYVIPVEPKPSTAAFATKPIGNDSREAIFDTVATMVDIMSRGGGVGINWSTLRPSGSYLSRVSGTSSGPVGWMDVASKAVGEVEQGGSRRGAAMFMLDDWHPDLMRFVEAKKDFTKITNANVSVAVSDSFMEAVKNDESWTLYFPDTTHPDYNTVWNGNLAEWKAGGRGVRSYGTVRARHLWDAIVGAAWASGEPGVVFLERYNKLSTASGIETIISVNPCGEQGLGPYSVCNLGSLNLTTFVNADRDGEGGFDWVVFRESARTATRFLDNVIDKSYYWDERSREQQKKLRRIGLGVMGLADTLLMLGIRYGSPEAVEFTEKVFQTLKDAAIEESVAIASEKGPAEAYHEGLWNRPYLMEYGLRQKSNSLTWLKPLRNLFFLTQAPTGTTSILAGVSSGIEPNFAWTYTRKDRTGVHEIVHPMARKYEGMRIEDLPHFMVTANDVSVEEHIAMQAAVQKYVDSSVSKTINGPNSHTVEDVDKAYMLAYDSGLKGLAYFRDGSGRDQVLSTKPKVDESSLATQLAAAYAQIKELEDEIIMKEGRQWKRPAVMTGETSRLNTSMGTLYLTINRDESGKPVEIFVNVGKAGSDVMAMGEAVGRLVSLSLQRDIPLVDIANQLVGVGGTSQFNPGLVHAIGRKLADESALSRSEDYQADPNPVEAVPVPVATTRIGDICPECQEFSFIREDGCQKCYNCGFSAC